MRDRLAGSGVCGLSAYRGVGSGAMKSGGPSDGVAGGITSRALKSESVKLR